MSTPTTTTPPPYQASPQARSHTKGTEKPLSPSPVALQEAASNAAILTATTATLSARDEPLALLLRTAIDELNKILEPQLGANAIESAVESGIDFSPEATAERIVSLATGFYGAFRDQNPDEVEPLPRFMNLIREGIDRGFAEARKILEGLQVLQGDIADNIDKTYDLVQGGLNRFEQQVGNPEAERETP